MKSNQPSRGVLPLPSDEFRSVLSTARLRLITVKKLFGFLSYSISVSEKKALLLLYGDNGCGKTTILNLLYHLLSPADGEGHRTFIAGKCFQEFSVSFVDNTVVTAIRPTAVAGPFTMKVCSAGSEVVHHFDVAPDGSVKAQKEPKSYGALIRALDKLGLGLFLLPDDRNIQSNLYPRESRTGPNRVVRIDEFTAMPMIEQEGASFDRYVELALARSFDWSRKQAIAASNQGETDTTKIYIEIISRLVTDKGKNVSREKVPYDQLLNEINSTQEQSVLFSKYGLTPPFIFSELIGQLEHIPPSKKGVVNQVLLPYLRSYQARLKALDRTRKTIDTFAGIFNSFYSNKRFTYDLKQGIKIESVNTGESLASGVLSSGEKQLLLLFCNVLLARSVPSVFIIDEPELSLNVKWQRRLIESLLACVEDCDVQFVFATHSIEMLASWKNCSSRLNNED
jgi:energy-coupling factor transporter ATP-binding protein EcfA2